MTLGTAAQLRSVAAVTTADVAFISVKPEMKSLGVIIDSHTYASTSMTQPSPRRVTITYTLCGTCGIC